MPRIAYALLLTLLPALSQAALVVEFTTTLDVNDGYSTFNGAGIGGETLSFRYVLGSATPLNSNYTNNASNNYFDLSSPEVTNTISISGVNGGTFSQDVFFAHNYLRFYNPGSSEQLFLRTGDRNANTLFSISTDFLAETATLDGTVDTVTSLLTQADFAGGTSTSISGGTTLEGGGNSLFVMIREFENVNVHVSEFSAVPNPGVLVLLGLGGLVGGLATRRVVGSGRLRAP
ncbi:MAG: hypothetical protein ACPGUC_07415 [Gammaproteobacteria bacterium]